MPEDIRIFGEIFFVDILCDFLKNNTDKNYAVMALYYVKRYFNIDKYCNNIDNLAYFQSILKKIINCQYISDINKKNVLKDFATFLN